MTQIEQSIQTTGEVKFVGASNNSDVNLQVFTLEQIENAMEQSNVPFLSRSKVKEKLLQLTEKAGV